MLSDEEKKANFFCIIGAIISLGTWLFFISIIRDILIRDITSWISWLYFFSFWLLPLITGILSIIGILITKTKGYIGYMVCIATGIVYCGFLIFSGFFFGLIFFTGFIFVITGPVLILIGGIIGYKEFR